MSTKTITGIPSSGSDTNAIHSNTGSEISAITAKTALVNNDIFLLEDSEATNAKKKTLWSNIKSVLKTYFDSIHESLSNKKTDLTDNSDTYYASQKAVKTAVDAKQDSLGFTPEDVSNKKTNLTDNSDTYYASQKAVKTAVDAKQDALVSGTNIKTVNSTSLLGSGDIAISGSSGLVFRMQGDATVGLNPVANRNYYFGCNRAGKIVFNINQQNPENRIYIPVDCTLTKVYGVIVAKVLNTAENEDSTLYIRLNDTSDIEVSSTLDFYNVNNIFNKTDLSQNLSAGDFLEIKLYTPASFTQNPFLAASFVIYCEI